MPRVAHIQMPADLRTRALHAVRSKNNLQELMQYVDSYHEEMPIIVHMNSPRRSAEAQEAEIRGWDPLSLIGYALLSPAALRIASQVMEISQRKSAPKV